MTRTVIRRAGLAIVVFLTCGGIGATFAAFSDTTSNSGNSFSSAATFLEFVKNVGTATCGGTSDSVTVPASGVAAGNTLIVRVGLRDRNPMPFTPAVSDSKGNTYQLDVDETQADAVGDHPVRAIIFSAYVTSALASGDTITFTHPNVDSPSMAVTEFRGVEQVARVDQTGSDGGTNGNPTASVTTTNTYDLVVGSVVNDETPSFTQPGGWNALPALTFDCGPPVPHTGSSLHGAYQIVAATGTFTYNPTLGSPQFWADVLASYKG